VWPEKVRSGLLGLPHSLIVLSRLHVLGSTARQHRGVGTLKEGAIQQRRAWQEDLTMLGSLLSCCGPDFMRTAQHNPRSIQDTCSGAHTG